MQLKEILGQDRVRTYLENAMAQDRLAHGLIFSGPEGVGKRTTALALARALFCTEAPGQGCNHCDDCHLMEAGTHPNLLIQDMARAREEKATTAQLSIAQVRRLRSDLHLQGIRGRRKVALIEPAEKLTTDAQNALLKTLEEPPRGTLLILITSNADALLPTIRSRCQRLLFAPLRVEAIATILENGGSDPAAAHVVAGLAAGSLTEAARLSTEETQEKTTEVQEKLENLDQLPLPDVLDFATQLSSGKGAERREKMALHTGILLDWARRSMHASANAADQPGTRRSLEILQRIHGTTQDLNHYANAQLSWETLLLDLRAILQRR